MAERYDLVKARRRDIVINNFLGGISWAVGATIGFSLLIALLSLIASKADLVPVVGTFVSQVLDFVLQHNQNLQ
jgi:hypothetical protein